MPRQLCVALLHASSWCRAESPAQGTAPWLTLSRCSCSCSEHPHRLSRSPHAGDHGSEWQLWGLTFLCSSKKGVVRTVTDHDPSNTPPHRSIQHAKELGRNPTPTGQPVSTLHISNNYHPSTEQGKGFGKGLSLSGTGLTTLKLFHTSYSFIEKLLFKCQMQQQV